MRKITGNWLKRMKFGETTVNGKKAYYMNGLYLSYWNDIGWRWQIGGIENMWEPVHTPTQDFVKCVLSALRGSDT